jgi:hypothetical protein
MANGELRLMDKAILSEIGKWIRFNKNFIYDCKSSEVTAENAIMLKGENGYYYAISGANMMADVNVAIGGKINCVKVNGKIKSAVWLDNGRKIKVKKKSEFEYSPFEYGTSMIYRVAKLKLEK